MKPIKKPKRFVDGKITRPPKKQIVDARNTIIQKNRSKIVDARDKLAQITKRSGDARLKLLKKNRNNQSSQRPMRMPKKQLRRPYNLIENRPVYSIDNNLMDMDEEYIPSAMSLRRTVQNDIAFAKMPPLPTFPSRSDLHRRPSPSPHMWSSDPFDCYEVPVGRPADVSEPKNLHRQIRNVNSEMMPGKGILRYFNKFSN